MSTISTIEKMDIALNAIYKNKHKRISIEQFIDEVYMPLTVVEVRGCLDIMQDEGYIKEIIDENYRRLPDGLIDQDLTGTFHEHLRQQYTFIVITMNGMLFKENGGYAGQHYRNIRSEKRDRNIHNLTWILALGVITPSIYNLIEILKYNPSGLNVQFLTAFFLLLSGILIGIIICLLISGITRKTK